MDRYDLSEMYNELKFYDVDQQCWEHDPNAKKEPKSPEENLYHVGTHIDKVLAFKDFSNPKVLKSEILPDSLMYGLRIARWFEINLEGLTNGKEHWQYQLGQLSQRLDTPRIGTLEYRGLILAKGYFSGQQLHDEAHESTRSEAIKLKYGRLRKASSLLIQLPLLSHEMDAKEQAPTAKDMFDLRLSELRERAGVLGVSMFNDSRWPHKDDGQE